MHLLPSPSCIYCKDRRVVAGPQERSCSFRLTPSDPLTAPRLPWCPSGTRKRRVMKPARAFLQVVLSVFLVAALVVSSGFAATKKLDRHRNERSTDWDKLGDWNDWSFRTANLLDAGSSVSSGSS